MKVFLKEKLTDYQQYLEQNIPILEQNGVVQSAMNFDFDEVSSQYIEYYEKQFEIRKQKILEERRILRQKQKEEKELKRQQELLLQQKLQEE